MLINQSKDIYVIMCITSYNVNQPASLDPGNHNIESITAINVVVVV